MDKTKPLINALVALATVIATIACSTKVEKDNQTVVNEERASRIDQDLSPYLLEVMASYDLPGLVVGIRCLVWAIA